MHDGDERDRRVRAQAEEFGVVVLPTDPYLGLTREQAQERAAREHRKLVDRTAAWTTRRANLSFARVNVRYDEAGRVAEADAG